MCHGTSYQKFLFGLFTVVSYLLSHFSPTISMWAVRLLNTYPFSSCQLMVKDEITGTVWVQVQNQMTDYKRSESITEHTLRLALRQSPQLSLVEELSRSR